MLSFGISEIQSKPSLMKSITVAKIVDRRAHRDLGYFISEKYAAYLEDILKKIERDERIAKLEKIKAGTDWEFVESDLDDEL